MNFKYLIVGGGVAGTSAAESIRSVDSEGSIGIVSNEEYVLYSKVMLSKPNYFTEKIAPEKAFLKSPDWYRQQNISFLGGKTASGLEPSKRSLSLSDGEILGYEKLLLAVGSIPSKWLVKGGDKKNIFSIRTFDDYGKIKSAVKTAGKIVIIGGGFIGFEMCDIFRTIGLEVIFVVRESHFWDPILDPISGRMVTEAIDKGGAKVLLKTEVIEVAGQETVEGVILNNGNKIPCDMIIVGIGNIVELEWLKNSGLAVNRGILANEYLETNLPDVWTAGDCSEYSDIILETKVQLGNWVNAQIQGKVAGLNIAGKKTPFRLVSSYNTSGFGINIAFVGDVRPEKDRIIVERDLPISNSHVRMLIQYGEMVGATAINGMADLGIISKIIESDIKVIGREPDLANPNFDLKTLVPH